LIYEITDQPVGNTMSAQKGPPTARHVLVPPLTSTTENGEPYKRRADVEDSIAQVLAQPPSEWVAIATVKGEHRLADEALVFLVRAAGSGLPDVVGGLVQELCRRLIRTAKRLAQGFDVSTTETIINSVEIEVIELILTKSPSRQSEFLEIAFKKAIERRTINAVEKYRHDPMSSIIETIQSSEDDHEPIDIVENLADAADGPEKLLLFREAEALNPELLQTACEAVKDHRHRKAVILHLAYRWPITSIDPNKPCLEKYFKISGRRIQDWIKQALKTMRSATGAKS
jgi:hypothetical protein